MCPPFFEQYRMSKQRFPPRHFGAAMALRSTRSRQVTFDAATLSPLPLGEGVKGPLAQQMVTSAPHRHASMTSKRRGMMGEAVVWEPSVVEPELEERFRRLVASHRERARRL